MDRISVRRWVLDAVTRIAPRWFTRARRPIRRHDSFRPGSDIILEPRESPTSLLGPTLGLASGAVALELADIGSHSSTETWHSPTSESVAAWENVPASDTGWASSAVRGSPDPGSTASEGSNASEASNHPTNQGESASRPAENWTSFSAVDDFFADPFALDASLMTTPHSSGSSGAGTFDDAHPHSSGNDGGSTAGGGFSSGSGGNLSGAGGVSPLSQANPLTGLVNNGSPSSAPTPVAKAPGSEIGAPTNLLLPASVPVATNHSPITNANPSPPTNPGYGALG
jgi:hypothetical protein